MDRRDAVSTRGPVRSGALFRLLAATALALGLLPAFAAARSDAAPTTLRVAAGGSDSGGCVTAPCATIGYAISRAGPGDAIEVGPGTYAEDLTVGPELTLRGPDVGVDASHSARGPEAVIAGTGATTVLAQGPGIAIEGLTIQGAGTYGIRTAAPVGGGGGDGLRIADDIFQGAQRGIALNVGAADVAVEGDLVEGGIYDLSLAGGSYGGLSIADNAFVGSPSAYAIFNGGEGTTFPGLRLEDNLVGYESNIGGNVEGGVISGNTFDVMAPGTLGLQIDLHGSLLADNTFEGNGSAACLQLFGSQYGLDPSDGATISANHFHGCAPYAIQLSPGIDHVAIAANTITDSYDGVDTRLLEGEAAWDLDGREIQIS